MLAIPTTQTQGCLQLQSEEHFMVFLHAVGHVSTVGGVTVFKNREPVFNAKSHQPTYQVNPSNGTSLLLEVGDVIYVKLWANAWVYDDGHHYTTFSGHLLFPM
ncbi:hypothetical protein AALO_G00227100 [Alosa alosa]|uniref:C1q domain-containing protein n=1 Tax=Alosa alosa TaxID=278164 RepID=A0AAV6G331_9TELE|nr:hypothetical protein AALO_G00227100 [Alosa alosa]